MLKRGLLLGMQDLLIEIASHPESLDRQVQVSSRRKEVLWTELRLICHRPRRKYILSIGHGLPLRCILVAPLGRLPVAGRLRPI